MTALPYSACWTIPDHVDRAAATWPDSECVVFGNVRLTFAQFKQRTVRFAAMLAALGVEHGDKVGVLFPNCIESLIATYGAPRIGAIAVPINNRLKAAEVAYLIADSEMRVLVTSAGTDSFDTDHVEQLMEAFPSLAGQDPMALALEQAPALRQIVLHGSVERPPAEMIGLERALALGAAIADEEIARRQLRAAVSDVVWLLYTSGTTAHPKGCLTAHEQMVRVGRVFAEQRFPSAHGDRVFDPLPLFHLASLLPFNACLHSGACYIGMEHFEPQEALRLLVQERCTLAFPAFDLIWAAIMDRPEFDDCDLTAIRIVNINGEPKRLREMSKRMPWLKQISPYGQTEGGGVICLSHVEDTLEQRIETTGRPFPGIEAQIIDPDSGKQLGPGERGEIVYRGWSLFQGYFKKEQETAELYLDGGYFRSGDYGSIDSDGRITFIGRLKDMLKVGGENVAAAEIEGHLALHPAVAMAQVVAAPDSKLQEVPCAYITLRAGHQVSEQEIIDFCLGQIARYKIPRYVRVVDEWPMSGTKIQKFVLRERIAAELRAAGIEYAARVG